MGVEHSEILAPEGAAARVFDRERKQDSRNLIRNNLVLLADLPDHGNVRLRCVVSADRIEADSLGQRIRSTPLAS